MVQIRDDCNIIIEIRDNKPSVSQASGLMGARQDNKSKTNGQIRLELIQN